MIGQVVGSYRILRQLGAGGMGVVYEAEDTRLGRHVALKFLPESVDVSPEAAARFEREARVASAINHPNICTIHDIGVVSTDGRERHFIVMELLEGESLRSRLGSGALPVDDVVDIGAAIADALDAAHAAGIVHRDVKPANIFLTRRGQAKLLDFGIARPGNTGAGAGDDETHAAADGLTVAGTTVGSINYMSPEQARGEPLDGRTDLFSLGLVLYEMATGRQAFGGATHAVVFDGILNRRPPPVRSLNAGVPEELERIVARAIEKDPKLRYQTASDLVADLRRLRRDSDVRRAVTGAQTAAAPLATGAATAASTAAGPAIDVRRRVPLGAIAVVVAVVAAAGWWFLRGDGTPAFTERDPIVIADFVNTTGDAVFDDALKQAVAVQFQQTPFVTPVADQQIQSTLRLMQQPADAAVVGAVARELCQRAGARATVEGSIAPLGTAYVIAIGVHDCQSGAAIAQEQVQADAKEDVLRVVGDVVNTLRAQLGESLASLEKYDAPAEATTGSLDALRAYGLAVRTRVTKGDEESIPFFRQAIEIDPDFALAHAKLGVVYSNLGRHEDARAATERAFALRDRVSEYERLYISWSYYARDGVADDRELEMLQLLTASYPRDFAARNNLGTYYMGRGEFDKALEQFQIAMEIAPNEPLPLSNAAQALFLLGRYEEALPLAERTLAVRPSGIAVTRMMHAHVRGDPREAEFREAVLKVVPADALASIDQGLAVWDGRQADYDAAVTRQLEALRASKRADELAAQELNALIGRALLHGGDHIETLRRALTTSDAPAAMKARAAAVLALLGDPAPARRGLPQWEESDLPDDVLAAVRAYVREANGEIDLAIDELRASIPADPRQAGRYLDLAVIQERNGRADDAIASYRKIVESAPGMGLNFGIAVARLELGRLLQARGDAAGAQEQFAVLARQWANADPEFGPARKLRELMAKQ